MAESMRDGNEGDTKLDLEALGITLPPFSNVTSLSDSQIRALFYPLWVIGPLGLFGTGLILFAIARRKLHESVYGRLMVGVCVSNLLTLSTLIPSPLSVPKQLLSDYGSMGTTESCTVTGLFLYVGCCGAAAYLLAMMIHFMLTICDGVSEAFAKSRLEKFYHGLVLLFCVSGGTIAVVQEIINAVGLVPQVCFLGSFPPNCHSVDFPIQCQRGGNVLSFLWALLLAPGIVMAVTFNISLLRIMHTVKMRANGSFSNLSTFRYLKTVERQTILYGVNYFLSYTLVLVLPILSAYINFRQHEKLLYRLQFMMVVLLPSSGLLNAATFFMPRYKLVAKRNVEAPMHWILSQVLFSKRESSDIVYRSNSSRITASIFQTSQNRSVASGPTEQRPESAPPFATV